MAGFSLKNTLSENGTVTRGICVADKDGYLEKVIETTGIQSANGKIQCDNEKVSRWITREATYWSQFSIRQWIESATLVGYFTGSGDVINGTTWFLILLFFSTQ